MPEKTAYDPVARLLHLVMAVGIIAALAVGLYMEDLKPTPEKWQLYGIHKSVGMILMALIIIRILWRGTHTPPAHIASQKKWEIALAKIVHIALYIVMIGMPVSGYIMSSAGGHAISIFGLVNVPLLISENKELGGTAREIHGLLGTVAIGAIALHFAGAMKHHIIDRDGTLGRMFPFMARK